MQSHQRRTSELARWPALASPWLSTEMRTAARLPALSPDCAPDGRDATEELRIEGIDDDSTLARPPNSVMPLRLSVRALGSEARIRWLLDGRLIGESQGASGFVHDFGETGTHTLTALADSGAWSRVSFRVMR
jgi:penicillin-binding protein 1C